MSEPNRRLSVTLPADLLAQLDRAAQDSGQTRSAIIRDVLREGLKKNHPLAAGPRSLDRLLKFAGAGAAYSTFKSGEEVDQWIRHIRGD